MVSRLDIGRHPLDYGSDAGHVDNLFFYLWAKNPVTGDVPPGVLLPHTAVFRRSKLHSWFFSSRKPPHHILRKRASESTIGNLVEVLVSAHRAGTSRSGIVAYIVTTEEGVTGDPFTYVEYLDKQAVLDLASGRRALPRSGFLQAFVEPKHGFNSTLRCFLRPGSFTVERRDSVHKIGERRIPFDARGATHEGQVHNSIPVPFSNSTFIRHLRAICLGIVRHVHATSPQQYSISSMAVNLKRNTKDQFVFLYASSVVVESRMNKIGLPDDIWSVALSLRGSSSLVGQRLTAAASRQRASAKGSFTASAMLARKRKSDLSACPGCGSHMPASLMYPVTYKAVIAHFDLYPSAYADSDASFRRTVTSLNASTVSRVASGTTSLLTRLDKPAVKANSPKANNSSVPPLLKRVMSTRMSDTEFALHRSNPAFLARSLAVCEACCLDITESAMRHLGKVPQPYVMDMAARRRDVIHGLVVKTRSRHSAHKRRTAAVRDRRTTSHSLSTKPPPRRRRQARSLTPIARDASSPQHYYQDITDEFSRREASRRSENAAARKLTRIMLLAEHNTTDSDEDDVASGGSDSPDSTAARLLRRLNSTNLHPSLVDLDTSSSSATLALRTSNSPDSPSKLPASSDPVPTVIPSRIRSGRRPSLAQLVVPVNLSTPASSSSSSSSSSSASRDP
ncbi:uncharacterized protein AMSG_08747 [Thecamonas trahens ATCC 50062]|uniref:Uncharacterized protein n=1 Tax=Thecamonas trahens ATCC 50062 TaxID=461836 RepID=A0A0L0DLR4_THETB|nr:hypothetical protein AMSG_08747 [Thecamonas trahens ATCC 50062]KNC53259.1 hypothetical protein AMSG_08747 [Thecamonas trahens ATCC 50062]|eukprot:XP_013754523.1 hypothetical protein AMSG_08747 [Thecamonas trahens ATCC 50062]